MGHKSLALYLDACKVLQLLYVQKAEPWPTKLQSREHMLGNSFKYVRSYVPYSPTPEPFPDTAYLWQV